MLWFSWLLFAFFFVKQKTAYEMRISDWSSDVCSSDLEPRRRMGGARRTGECGRADLYRDAAERVCRQGRRNVSPLDRRHTDGAAGRARGGCGGDPFPGVGHGEFDDRERGDG